MAAPWVRATTAWTTLYKRTWRGSMFSSFLSPVLFLAAMGKGLGSLVDANHSLGSGLGGVKYIVFIAPGLLATSTLQVASQEGMYPVVGAVLWNRSYVAMVNTPLEPRDAMWGHFSYMFARALSVAAIYTFVMSLFGAIKSPMVLAAIPAAALGGMAMAVPIAAFSVTRRVDKSFAAVNRFILIPMTLFAGAFFPVRQLPALIRPIAYVTPMWHSVDLCRSLALGNATLLRSLGHVAFLGAFVAVGVVIASRCYRRVLTQ